jgi:hypothetical protein
MADMINGLSQQFTDAAAAGGWRLQRMTRRTYSFAVDGGAAGTYTMFRVTGTVLVQVFGVCQTSLAGAGATIELGIVGNTAALIALTTATDLDEFELWQDASPETTDINPGKVDLTARSFVVTNGTDIGLKVTTADLTAGVIDFYCFWTPLSGNGAVEAA